MEEHVEQNKIDNVDNVNRYICNKEGFIFLVLPFSLAYMMELQKQMMESKNDDI